MLMAMIGWVVCIICVLQVTVNGATLRLNDCDNDYEQFFETPCQKGWKKFTEAALVWSFSKHLHIGEVYYSALRYVTALLYICSPLTNQPNATGNFNSTLLEFKYNPCGQMYEDLFPIRKRTKLWDIIVAKDFAVNITFLLFYLDEPNSVTSQCTHSYLTIQYYNASGRLCDVDGSRHCSWKVPWSVIVPSHHVLLTLTSNMVVRYYEIQYIYQILEKCHHFYSQLRVHNIKYIDDIENVFIIAPENLKYNWIVRGWPGYIQHLNLMACEPSNSTAVELCDGPLPLYCKNVTIVCKPISLTSTMFHSLIRLFSVSYKFESNVNITYTNSPLKSTQITITRDVKFPVVTKHMPLFHKTWELYSDVAINIEFVISEFMGSTESNCQFGGYGIYPSKKEYTYEDLNTSRYMDSHLSHRFYGPFCVAAPAVPLLNSEQPRLTLPNGTQVFVMYSFSDIFNIDVLVKIKINKNYTGHINICNICSWVRAPGPLTLIAYDHLAFVILHCLPAIYPLQVRLRFASSHPGMMIQHIAGENYPCDIVMERDKFHPLFTSTFSLDFTYVATLNRHYEFDSSCTNGQSSFEISDHQEKQVEVNNNYDYRKEFKSKAFYITINIPCDVVYGYGIWYKMSYELIKHKNICLKKQNDSNGSDSYFIDSDSVCSNFRLDRPLIFVLVLKRLFYKYNMDIHRKGGCSSDDVIHVMYGLRQTLPGDTCELSYTTHHVAQMYNTMIIADNSSVVRLEIPKGYFMLQIKKFSQIGCLLYINLEMFFLRDKHYEKRIQCVVLNGYFPHQNQVCPIVHVVSM